MADTKHTPSVPLGDGFAARVATIEAGDSSAPAVSNERAQAIVQETLASAAKTDPLVAAALQNPDLTIVVVPGKNVNAFSDDFSLNQAAFVDANKSVAGFSRSAGDKREIYIAADLPPAQRARTLEHEARHAALGTVYDTKAQTPFKIASKAIDSSDGINLLHFGDGSSRNRAYFALLGDAMESLQADAISSGNSTPAIVLLNESFGLPEGIYTKNVLYAEIPVRIADKLARGEWTASDEKHFGGLRRFHEDVIQRDAELYRQNPAAYDNGELKFPEVDVEQLRGRAPATPQNRAPATPAEEPHVAQPAPDAASPPPEAPDAKRTAATPGDDTPAAQPDAPAPAKSEPPSPKTMNQYQFEDMTKQLRNFAGHEKGSGASGITSGGVMERIEGYYLAWHLADITDAEIVQCHIDAGLGEKAGHERLAALGKRSDFGGRIAEHKPEFLKAYTDHLRAAHDINTALADVKAATVIQKGQAYIPGEAWQKFQERMEHVAPQLQEVSQQYERLGTQLHEQGFFNKPRNDPRWTSDLSPSDNRSASHVAKTLAEDIHRFVGTAQPADAAALPKALAKPAPAPKAPAPEVQSSDNIPPRPVTAVAAPGEDAPPPAPPKTAEAAAVEKPEPAAQPEARAPHAAGSLVTQAEFIRHAKTLGEKSAYDVLGANASATPQDIETAYAKRMDEIDRLHPATQATPEHFEARRAARAEANAAFVMLSEHRGTYDQAMEIHAHVKALGGKQNAYEVLGVPPGADPQTYKAAYEAEMKIIPDGPEFAPHRARVEAAGAILAHDGNRAAYNQSAGIQPATHASPDGHAPAPDAPSVSAGHPAPPRYSGSSGQFVQTIIAAKDYKEALASGDGTAIVTTGAGLATNITSTVVEVAKDVGKITEKSGGAMLKYLGAAGTAINALNAGMRVAQAETLEEGFKTGMEAGMQIGAGVALSTGAIGTVIGTGAASAAAATTAALGGGAAAVVAGTVVAVAVPLAVGAAVTAEVAGVYKIGEAAFDITSNYNVVDNTTFKPDQYTHRNLLAAEGRILGNAQMAEELAAAGVPKNAEGKVTLQALNRALADRTHGDAVSAKLGELIERQRSQAAEVVAKGGVSRYFLGNEAAADRQMAFESAKMDERSFASAKEEMSSFREVAIDKRDRAESQARYEAMERQKQAEEQSVAQAKAAQQEALKPFKELPPSMQALITESLEEQYKKQADGAKGEEKFIPAGGTTAAHDPGGYKAREAFVAAGQIAVANNPAALEAYAKLDEQTRFVAAKELESQKAHGIKGSNDPDALQRQESYQRTVALRDPEQFDRQYAQHRKEDAEYAKAKGRYNELSDHDKALVDAKLKDGLEKFKREGGTDEASFKKEMLAFHVENVGDLRVHEQLAAMDRQAEEKFAKLSSSDKALVTAAMQKDKRESLYPENDKDLLRKYTEKSKLNELRVAAAEQRTHGQPEVQVAKKDHTGLPLGKENPTSITSFEELLAKDVAKNGEFTKLARNPQEVDPAKTTGHEARAATEVAVAPPQPAQESARSA